MLIGTAGEDLQKGDAVVWVHTDKGSMLYKARPEDVGRRLPKHKDVGIKVSTYRKIVDSIVNKWPKIIISIRPQFGNFEADKLTVNMEHRSITYWIEED